MENPPIDILIHETKAKILTAINKSGLPPALLDPIISSILADVRGQSNLDMLNYVESIRKELDESKNTEGKKKEVKNNE